MNIFKANKIEYGVTIFIGVSLILGIYYAFVLGQQRFELEYVVEDGVIEYGTALFLLAIGLYNLSKFIKYRQSHKLLWSVGTLLLALLFIFGAGEEISWGQRLFGFETPDSLKEINRQDETTLHNIRIGDFDVNKLIFSQLLTVILILYFALYPILYRRVSWIQKTSDLFGIPVPQWRHMIIFLIATSVALIIPSEKKWELHEFAFAAVFFIIFLFPFNKKNIS